MARVIGAIHKVECRGETHRIQEMDGGAITPLDCTWEQVRAEWLAASICGKPALEGCAWTIVRLLSERRLASTVGTTTSHPASAGGSPRCLADCTPSQRAECRIMWRIELGLVASGALRGHGLHGWHFRPCSSGRKRIDRYLRARGSSLVEYYRHLWSKRKV